MNARRSSARHMVPRRGLFLAAKALVATGVAGVLAVVKGDVPGGRAAFERAVGRRPCWRRSSSNYLW